MTARQEDSSQPATGSRRKIRSFMRREGRMSKRQTHAYHSLFPKYGIEFNNQPLNFNAVFNNPYPTVLEIGFGMGDTLAKMAEENPDTNFIGIEVHRPGVGSLLATMEEKHIDNIRVFCHDAVEILQHAIPDQSLHAIHIFFPDPWPKKRHHKRRLIQPAFVKLLSEKVHTDGVLHIATDWKPYADWILEIMAASPDFREVPENSSYQRPTTKFEKRGLRLGHGVWDMVFKKKQPEQIRP